MGEQISESDLYPGVRPTLTRLRQQGFWAGMSPTSGATGPTTSPHAPQRTAGHGTAIQIE
jgi:hypothetical protein